MNTPSPAAIALISQVATYASQDFEPAVRGYLRMLKELTGMESTMLLVIDYGSEELLQRAEYVEVSHDNLIPIIEGDAFPWMVGGCRLLRESGRSFSSDMQADYEDFELGRSIGIHGYLSVPIEIGPEHRLVGTLCAMQPHAFTVGDEVIGIARVIAQLVAVRFDREARIAAERARSAATEEQLCSWIAKVVTHEQHVRTDLTVISGLVALAHDTSAPELLQPAIERIAGLEGHVDRFVAVARDSLRSAAQDEQVNVVELVHEIRRARGDPAVERNGTAVGEAWVCAQPEVLRSLLGLLYRQGTPDDPWPMVEFLVDSASVVISTSGDLRTLNMSILRVLVDGLDGHMSWQALPGGSGRLEIALPLVPAPVHL